MSLLETHRLVSELHSLTPKEFLKFIYSGSHLFPPLKYPNRPSCDKHEFYVKNNEFVSLPCPSAILLRYHWDKHNLPQVEQKLILTVLPGKKQQCKKCKFHMPEICMENETTCSYCAQKNHDGFQEHCQRVLGETKIQHGHRCRRRKGKHDKFRRTTTCRRDHQTPLLETSRLVPIGPSIGNDKL